MPMIQGIDGNALLNAFRQGRSDRADQDKAQAEKARQEQRAGIMASMFPQSGGVASQFAPSQPAQRPSMAVPDAFMQSPDQAPERPLAAAMGALPGMDAGGAAPAAPQAPQMRQVSDLTAGDA